MALATYILMAITYAYSVWLLWDQGRSAPRDRRLAQPTSRELESRPLVPAATRPTATSRNVRAMDRRFVF
ncbi:MAG: hypothetical protein HYR72_00860 [Deltaproteobacteria bacterium]|nr:hypothetical protein [Deltaproteobacteria bacterium]